MPAASVHIRVTGHCARDKGAYQCTSLAGTWECDGMAIGPRLPRRDLSVRLICPYFLQTSGEIMPLPRRKLRARLAIHHSMIIIRPKLVPLIIKPKLLSLPRQCLPMMKMRRWPHQSRRRARARQGA